MDRVSDTTENKFDDPGMEEGSLAGDPPQSRRDARELALKILYAQELSDGSIESILRDFLGDNSGKYERFVRRLVGKIESARTEIDELITKRSEKWEFARIAVIDKLILRMAIAEIMFFPDIPPKVTINEAIEIAKDYSTGNSGRFINGILDAVYNSVRKDIIKNSS